MTKFAFFDLDKTLYDGLSTVDFYFLMAESGWIDKEIYRQDEALRQAYTGSAADYNTLSRKAIELGISKLKGYTRAHVLEMEKEFMAVSQKYYPYTRPLIKLLQEHGFFCYLISAAIFPPVEAIAHDLSIPHHASTAVMNGHTYTGELKKFLNGEEKRNAVHDILSHAGQPTFSLAFGDSTGDLPLLEIAVTAFVINPHQEEMKALADEKGYQLVTGETVIKVVRQAIEN